MHNSIQPSLVNSLSAQKKKKEPHGELPSAYFINKAVGIVCNLFPAPRMTEIHSACF